jgi:hypothetical protein
MFCQTGQHSFDFVVPIGQAISLGWCDMTPRARHVQVCSSFFARTAGVVKVGCKVAIGLLAEAFGNQRGETASAASRAF